MSKEVTAIRFESQEKEWIDTFAHMNGKSFSAQVREWTLERLEDEMDARDLLEAIRESAGDSEDTGISIAEFLNKYEIA
jgi:predicted DNA-binding protein